MDRDTYTKQAVIDMLNKDFVAIKFNPEIKFDEYDIEGAKYTSSQLFSMLCNNQRVGYPTTVFLFTSNKKIYLQSGYQDEANFKKLLEYYLSLKDK
jgi:thioredoxin-related protein